jgi:NAD(P)-dependent dehydrogenase (short-subunit alcohol dehydrogenase family)
MKHKFFENKVWFITGGSSGLGKALAFEALKAGGKVAAVARHASDHAFREWGDRFIFIQGDISQKENIHRLTGEAVARLGRIDILVNNASHLGPTPLGPFMDLECEDFENVLQTNLLAPFRFTKAVLASMILREEGIVVNISSDAAVEPYPNWGAYGSSKAALDHLTRIWAQEVPAVKFYAFDPGEMNTPMHAAAIPEADVLTLQKPQDVARRLLSELASSNPGPVRRIL